MIDTGVVSAEDLDRIMQYGLGFRYPWIGPIKTADLGGLDVFHSIATYLYKELSAEQKPPESFTKLVSQNNLGLKQVAGFIYTHLRFVKRLWQSVTSVLLGSGNS